MYPNLYYAFEDLFGLDWPLLRYVNSFGFFVAIAFILGAVVLAAELRRKSRLGQLQPTEMEVMVGQPATPGELLLNFLLGFLLGYKILALFLFKPEDPQAFIFSTMGSWPAGIALGVLFAGLKWWDRSKKRLAKPEKRTVRIWPQDRVGEMTIIALVFGLLGAKLFDIFENWSGFVKDPGAYLFSPSGLTFYGGLICAALALWWYAKRHRINFWHLNDALAPAMMLAYGIGRIGCHVSGDGDWGIPNTRPKPGFLPDWLWSYTYPHNVNEEGIPIPGCVGKYCNELPVGVYPTSVYETLICLALFGLLWSLRKKLTVPGTMFALYLVLNGVERFFIEKIRVNVRMNLFGLRPTQAEVISFLLVLVGVILWILLIRRARKQKLAKA
ncbi:MAG TPA: prolipoprotein diacylglyceryl transferase family protein [Chitinophagaceae bacterium]|nr:prolipoprotein diacylglyceryl transferase family protein [Chitinophagaceae bacterium]